MARAPGRWRAVVLALVLSQAWSSMPVVAQGPPSPDPGTDLPPECALSPQVVNPTPVGLDDPGRHETISIPGGSTTCLEYVPTDITQQVTLDLATSTPTSGYTAQMLSQVNGGEAWAQTPVPAGSRVHLCFSQPTQDIAHLYLVIANVATAPEEAVDGSVRVRPVALPCGTWAVHARYAEYVGAQVSLSVTLMGEISLSRDPVDDPSPQALTYILEFGEAEADGDAGTASFAAPIAQIGGPIAAAADTSGSPRRGCARTSRVRYTGTTVITLPVIGGGGPITIDLRDASPDFGYDLVNELFLMFERMVGPLFAMLFVSQMLLVIITPLLLDLAKFQLAVLAEQALTRTGRTDCGLTTTRRSRTVVQLSDR